jgi:hypothetical protein
MHWFRVGGNFPFVASNSVVRKETGACWAGIGVELGWQWPAGPWWAGVGENNGSARENGESSRGSDFKFSNSFSSSWFDSKSKQNQIQMISTQI